MVAALEAIREDQARVFGPDAPETLMMRGELAEAQGQSGNVAAAVTELENLLTDQLRILSGDHPDTWATRLTLARWRGHAGDAAAAVSELTGLLADQLRVLPAEHRDLWAIRYELAYWRGEAGDLSTTLTELAALGRAVPSENPLYGYLQMLFLHYANAAGHSQAGEALEEMFQNIIGSMVDNPTPETSQILSNYRRRLEADGEA